MHSVNRRSAIALIAAGLGAVSTSTRAQSAPGFPGRPIRMVSGGVVGGSSDVLGRTIGEHMFRASGQPFVMDAKPGANQALAIKEVARASPDGHTLLIATTGFTLNLLRSPAPYKSEELAPVAHLAYLPTVLAVSSTLGVETLDQFLAVVRASPGKYSYGTPGVASAPHVNAELLSVRERLKLVHIPYKGEAALVTDLVSGDIAATWATLAILTPLAKAGKVKLIAVTGDARLPAAPGIPTSTELGHPMLTGYFGLWTTGGTPVSVIRQLSEEVMRIVRIPAVAQSITQMGAVPVGAGSDAFSALLQSELRRWKDAAAATGIQFV